MFEISRLLILIPALPLAAAVIVAVLGPRLLRGRSHWPVILGIGLSFLCSLMLAQRVHEQVAINGAAGSVTWHTYWSWVNVERAFTQAPAPGVTGGAAVGGGVRDFAIGVTLRADSLTAIMLMMVTFVSLLVAIYSVGYMRGDRGYWRFFAYVSLFVFSMTMLVSVSNFLLLYVFWEAVGVCSYLLIGFWYQKPEAAAAGKKAFLVNRIGDFGFALALFLIWTVYGTLNFHDTFVYLPHSNTTQFVAGILGEARLTDQVGYQGETVGLAICLLLLLGACGKSAQFPLHVWLPDAMEGPTPVSALIHAATMVTAGVYLVARCIPLFAASPTALVVVAIVGGITSLMAAVIAMTQFDLKRVLAYSTISQLGYMFVALGTGTAWGVTAGMFHLFTHAFFKALLFLGAGSVMHAMGNVMDMRRFGGLRRRMPITHWTFAFGCLALAGVFPFAGFWSKDAIIASVHDRAHSMAHEYQLRAGTAGGTHAAGEASPHQAAGIVPVSSPGSGSHPPTRRVGPQFMGMTTAQVQTQARVFGVLYYVTLVTAWLTAIYTFRAFFMTFYGRETIPYEAGDHAHESPAAMWVPLSILAAFALAVGFGCERTHLFAGYLGLTPSIAHLAGAAGAAPGSHFMIAVVSTVIAVGGVGLAAFLYLGHRREVDALTYLMDFRWLHRLAELEWAARLARLPAVTAIQRCADGVGLGSVSRAFGYALLLLLCVLISPFLIGYYLSPYKLSAGKFFFDELYDAIVVWPIRMLARFSYAVDRWIVDGLVNLVGRIPLWMGGLMRPLQMGLIPFYGLAMVLGMITLIAARMIWGGG